MKDSHTIAKFFNIPDAHQKITYSGLSFLFIIINIIIVIIILFLHICSYYVRASPIMSFLANH